MRRVLFFFLIVISQQVVAQRSCVSHEYTAQQELLSPAYKQNITRAEAFLQQNAAKNKATASRTQTNIIIRIPVVVHVLYNSSVQNISEAQIKSQIDALNRDFRRKNADSVNTPDRFKNVAADVEIEFQLATADPQGRPTNGIVRKQSNIRYWQSDDKIKFTNQGGDDAWDANSYLNLWVGPMRSLLGYSSAPGGPAEKDGVVINTSAFGTINTAAPYHMGRTAVHEIGHWLGLKHIWGDDACGDDYIDDTPKQGGFTPGCPNGFRTSCSNGSLGDMYMNYMDFTDDACMNMFTEGQKQRMRSLFAFKGPRSSLLSSKGLNTPWVEAVPLPNKKVAPALLHIYPNPAQHQITINTEYDNTWIGKTVTIVSAAGYIVKQVLLTSANQQITITDLKSGIYLIQANNGVKKIREKLVKL